MICSSCGGVRVWSVWCVTVVRGGGVMVVEVYMVVMMMMGVVVLVQRVKRPQRDGLDNRVGQWLLGEKQGLLE